MIFSNWKVYGIEDTFITEGLSQDEATYLVDLALNAGGYAYAVNPNGVTYPADLHDGGSYDPAFS